jgi:hypothetical protein
MVVVSVSSDPLDVESKGRPQRGGLFALSGVIHMPPFLVTEELAVIWTGRPASTIRRWASEGRITRHGHGRGNVRYDLAEMHAKTEAGDGTIVPGEAPAKRVPVAA